MGGSLLLPTRTVRDHVLAPTSYADGWMEHNTGDFGGNTTIVNKVTAVLSSPFRASLLYSKTLYNVIITLK